MINPLAEVTFGSVSVPMVIALVVITAAYAHRTRELAAGRHRVPAWRQACFYTGIAILVLEPLSPLGASDKNSFVSHMIEHLLIGDLAALVIVFGLTGPLIAPLLRIDLVAKLRVLAHPAVALPIWTLNYYVWHIPFMMDAALQHDAVHVLQHILFFTAGFNMWMPLFGPLPVPSWFNNVAKLIYIGIVRFAGMALGNALVFSGSVFYTTYIGADNMWGLSALADQSIAGAVMMTENTFLALALAIWLFLKAAREGDETQDLIDLAHEHGFELSQERSARAVAAGAGERLRERILQGGSDDLGLNPPQASVAGKDDLDIRDFE